MAHACFCLRVFGFSPTNSTKRAERPHNQNRVHSSSKGKTRWVMTSVASLYRRLHVYSVFRHRIRSRLCYHHGFIVNGCRFTCQTTPPFTIRNLSAVTLPTWLPRFRWISRTKQKCLDCMFRISFYCLPFHNTFDLWRQILLVCDALGHLRAGQPLEGQHFCVPRRLNLPDSADWYKWAQCILHTTNKPLLFSLPAFCRWKMFCVKLKSVYFWAARVCCVCACDVDRTCHSQSNSQGVSSPQKRIFYLRDPVWVQEPNRLTRPLKKKRFMVVFGRLKCIQFLERSITDLMKDKRHKYQLLRNIE